MLHLSGAETCGELVTSKAACRCVLPKSLINLLGIKITYSRSPFGMFISRKVFGAEGFTVENEIIKILFDRRLLMPNSTSCVNILQLIKNVKQSHYRSGVAQRVPII